MSYITAAQLLATLNVSNPDSQRTSDATSAVNAATTAIDQLCQRPGTATRDGFGVDTATADRYYSPIDWDHLDIADLSTATGLVVVSRDDGGNVDTNDGGLNTWTVNTDFYLEDMNAAVKQWPYTRLRVNPTGSFTFNQYYPRSVKVTGKWGWPAVPAPVTDACTLLAERIYKMKREAPLGVIALADAAVRIARADNNLMLLLGPYMRHRGAAA